MPDKVFIDTNVFFYLYSLDEAEKRSKAAKVLNTYECITSTQVLNELCNIFIKKMKLPIEAVKTVIHEICSSCDIVEVNRDTIEQALKLHNKYKYSYYDCLVLSSALSSNCKIIFTEDLHDTHIINNRLTVVNILSS